MKHSLIQILRLWGFLNFKLIQILDLIVSLTVGLTVGLIVDLTVGQT